MRKIIFVDDDQKVIQKLNPELSLKRIKNDVQSDFIHSVPGLENVKINRFGYGIEYDVVDSAQSYPTLESKPVRNLYLAGQINGTTGYEEAAAQGLIAGINAALSVKNKAPLISTVRGFGYKIGEE